MIEYCGGIYLNKVHFQIRDSRIENNYMHNKINQNQFVGWGTLINTTVDGIYYP